jgi:16S rRNA pseudouridine516 synthase
VPDIEAFAAGIALRDFTAMPAALAIQQSGLDAACALCGVREGKYHQVRRMFAARGRLVTYLKRLSIGPLALDDSLAPGAYRELTAKEETALYAAVDLKPPDTSSP